MDYEKEPVKSWGVELRRDDLHLDGGICPHENCGASIIPKNARSVVGFSITPPSLTVSRICLCFSF